MTSSSSDSFRAVLDPVRALRTEDGEPTPEARDAARVALLAAIEAEQARGRAPRRPRAPRPARRRREPGAGASRRRVALVLAGVAVTAAAVGIGVGGGGSGPVDPQGGGSGPRLVSSFGVPDASAAPALRAAAKASLGLPERPLTAGTEWVVRSRSSELLTGGPNGLGDTGNGDDRYAAVLTLEGESRTTIDGETRATSRQVGELRFTTKGSEEGYEKAGRPSLYRGGTGDYPVIHPGHGTSRPFSFGREQLSYEELTALPTDTAELGKRVRDAARTVDDEGTVYGDHDFARVRIIADLMTRAPLPPTLRAALWRVAADLPGVRSLGTIEDPEGRPGQGITVSTGEERAEIVFDPSTGMMLSDWIYRTKPVTACASDLAPCSAKGDPARAPDGSGWRELAVPGTVAMGRTVLEAAVRPT